MISAAAPSPGFDWTALWQTIVVVYNSTPVQVLMIVLGAIILRIVLQFVIRRVVDRVVHGVKKKQNTEDTQALLSSPLAAVRIVQRTRTLGSVLNNLVSSVIVIVAVLLIVVTINPEITGAFALITAALGAGLGFGAQNIVKDVLSGLFIVAEDQLGVGDVVDLGPATGVVEDVGIRITKIRDVNGTLWFVRNGEILRVGNLSQGWSRVVIDVTVPHDADSDAAQERMLDTAIALTTDSKWRTRTLEKPELWGVEAITDQGVVIRLALKTRSAAKDDVARELRNRIARALGDLGVKPPALSLVTLSGFDGATSVKGARPPRTHPVEVQPAVAPRRRTRAAIAAPGAVGSAGADPRGFTPEKAPRKPREPRESTTVETTE